MTTPDQLAAIFERIAEGKHTKADVEALQQALRLGNHQDLVQVGKYNVNISEGQDIYIGDRIFHGLDAEAIKEAVRAVLQEQTYRSDITTQQHSKLETRGIGNTGSHPKLVPYLEWLIRHHNRLELRGVREIQGYPTVPLEKVYVALKGDRASSTERLNAYEALKREEQYLFSILPLIEEEFTAQEIKEELGFIRRQILVGHPLMPSLVERDRLPSDFSFQSEVITLGEAFQHERWLVILGDPGSGKTTLARWLTVKLAQAMLTKADNVIVSLGEVDPEVKESSKTVNLGPTRLPVLLRVSDYAEAYEKEPLMLIDYLGYHPWFGQFPSHSGERLEPQSMNALIKNHLRRGEAVIILDGLDEITGSTTREDIVREIETFIEDWVNGKGQTKSQQLNNYWWDLLDFGSPVSTGGNQIIITSRIVGYHASPLRGNLTHVTIEPMRRVAVEHFCDTWTLAIYQQIRPNNPPEVIEEIAASESQALKSAIYDPERPRIRELASNPLLVTILGLVFHSRGSLPQHRAELYQLAMEILIEDWRKTGLTAEELIMVLSPLAAYIHQNYPTGLIEHRELKELVAKYLQESPSFRSQDQIMHEKVENFLRIVREDVGLLAARGEFLYGFLHLTFQEYLAALYLVRSEATAGEEIIARLGDPRWREPILLALGHVSSAWGPVAYETMLRALLDADDPLEDLLPRTSLLIVAAMDEMVTVSEAIVQEVAQKLLSTYANRNRLIRFESLRKQIENAFSQLYSPRNSNAIEKWLCEILRNPPQVELDLAPAAATLIRQQKWFTPAIAQALLEALPHDNGAWNYPINQCVQDIITPQPEHKEPTPPKLPTEEEWETLKANDFTKYQELKTNVAIAQAAYRDQKDKYDRLVQQKAIDLPVTHLPFRKALQQNPSLVDRIKSNPAWLRLIVALYGGYYNYKAPEVLREYRDIVLFLLKPDKLRQDEIARNREYYIGDFGADDPVYNAAVYLDVGMGGKLDKVKILPEFKIEAIYRDSPLTNRILSAIRKDEPTESLIPYLRNLWTNSKHSEQQADAFIALAALGEDVISVLENTPATSDNQKVFKLIFDELSQLKEFLRDPITRALQAEVELPEPLIHPEKLKTKDGQDYLTIARRSKVILSIEIFAQSLQDLHWKDLLSTLANLTLTYSNKPLEYTTWDEHLSPLPRAYVNAEYWICRFLGEGGGGDDFIYNCALALDKMAASSADLIVHSLALLHQTQNLTWSEYITSWFVERLPPRFTPRSDIPLEVIDAVENINTEKLRPDLREALRSVFLDAMVPLVKTNSNLLPETLTLNLLNTESGESVIQSLAPQIRNSYDKPARILEMINQVEDPYFRSRALLRLARYLPFRFGHLFNQSLEVARTINDPHLRCRVFEYLLPSIPTSSYDQILEETLLSARTISDPDDKARALARLSRFCLEGQEKSLLQNALLAASNIADEYQKAEILQGLHQFLISYPDLLAQSRVIARQISDSWSRAKALGLRSPQLLQIHPQLQKTLGGSVDLWSPLVLGTIVNDLLTYFNEAINLDGQWLALANSPEQSKIANLYEAGIERGLTLTYAAVRALDQLLNSGDEETVRQFLPLLQDPTQDALPTIETWLNHWDENIANHAALFLSENERRLTPQTIDGLIALLNSREDRSRIRASLVLAGGITAVKREKRFFRTSELDSYVLEALGQAIHDYKNESPFVRGIIFSTQYDFIHDNPNFIEEWAKTLQSNEGNVSAAEENLVGIAELTSETWQTFRQAFENGNKQVQKAMLFALCWLSLENNTQSYTEDPGSWLKTLNLDGLEDVCALPRVPCPIIQSSVSALQQKRNNPEIGLIETAEKALKTYTITAAQTLAVQGDEVKNLLGEIATSVTYWSGTGSIFKDASEKYAVLVEDEPEIFSFLVSWLAKTLSTSVCNDGYFWKHTLLLADVAVYSERSPATFANLAGDFNLEPLLAEAVKKHNSIPGRVAAIQLISHLNRISADTLDALQQALLDDHYVREAAMETLTRLQRIEGEVVDSLIKRLYDQSATVAYTSARVLSLLGRSDKTKPQQRQRIITALADAVRASQSQRGIYTISGTGADQASHLRLFYQGRLDQAFFQALLEVSGVL
ncbi:MAG: signal transduction protein with Nacht domain protein [Symploca sp. SIO3C6]|nr:signal transduction protein with Nacht domain protein [Symploca sp. SIO3C6]